MNTEGTEGDGIPSMEQALASVAAFRAAEAERLRQESERLLEEQLRLLGAYFD